MNSERLWNWALPAALVLLTVVMRLVGIAENSITQDESTMVLFAQGVLERGYPFLRQAHGDFLISTYELVPYPIALSIGLFGLSEYSVRLPAVCFAAVTSVLILRFASTLFDRRTGVLAALLFALLPWTTYWGANAFYPSQVTLAALLATMAVHRLAVVDEPQPRDYAALLAAVTFTYLTWEGSAGLLPTFFVMLIVFRWGRWRWLAGASAWAVALGTLFIVVGQLTWRTVLREPYQGVITGRSDVSFAKLAFTSPSFDPYFYANGLLSEAHLVIAGCLLLGLVWLRRSFGLRFLYLFLALYIAVLASLLGYYALRYVFLTAPAFLMAAAAVTVMLADRIASGSRQVAAAALAGLVALHLSVSTPWGLQPVEASGELVVTARPNELRRDLPGFSFRSMATLLMERYRPGDKVIVQAPFPFQVYTGMRGDYFLQSVTASSVFFQPAALPYYTDKWASNPVLRTQSELDQVLAENDRVWFVSVPDGASLQSVGAGLYESLVKRLRLVGETGDGRLYLWVNPRVRTVEPDSYSPR
jgi:4-amino-4-deoxy-L-arabinose transferase-like glycosyltransferase